MKDKNKRKKIAQKKRVALRAKIKRENKPPTMKTNSDGEWISI